MPRTRSSKPIEIALDIGENEKDPQEFKECVILAEKLGFNVAWLGIISCPGCTAAIALLLSGP